MRRINRAASILLLVLTFAPTPTHSFAKTTGKKTSKKPAAGGGFGAVAKQPKLDAKAKKILEQAGGNVDAAQEQQFQNALQKLSKTEPELFEALMDAEGGLPTGPAHAKLNELFWDSVATYIPARGGQRTVDGPMSSAAKRKISAIAGCSVASGPAVLDVGCGDGAMLSHLVKAGADPKSYLGLDVSSRMIEAAALAHPRAKFQKADFLAMQPTETFDCCLLNGASQFFADQSELLAAACAWLRPGGRVVISHAQGAGFVRSEYEGNRAVARSCLPDSDALAALAEELQLTLLPAEECVPTAEGAVPHTHAGEHFYLVALTKPAN